MLDRSRGDIPIMYNVNQLRRSLWQEREALSAIHDKLPKGKSRDAVNRERIISDQIRYQVNAERKPELTHAQVSRFRENAIRSTNEYLPRGTTRS